MARIRTIKPEFQQSQSMGRVSRDARLIFILMWPQADDSGRLRGSLTLLSATLLPYDTDAPKHIEKWAEELEREGCIQRYNHNGNDYIQIVNWDHQKIEKPSKSRFPPPPPRTFPEASPNIPRPVGDRSALDQGPRTKDQGPCSGSLSREPGGEPPPKVNGKVVQLKEASAGPTDPWKAIFQRGREVLKEHAGHQVALLRKLYDNKPRKVLAKIEDAAEQRDPPAWVYAFLHKVDDEGRLSGEYIGGVAPI